MKYWHINFEDNDYWIEVDEEGVALRQIVDVFNGTSQLSCLKDCLAEGEFNYQDMDGSVKEITEMLFEKKWSDEIQKYHNKWQSLIFKMERALGVEVYYLNVKALLYLE